MEDRKIIELYWQRKETAITETELKYGSLCYGIAWRILQNREDAQECVQDTLLTAWDKIPPECPESLSAYLATVVRNYSISRIREKLCQKRGGGEVLLSLEELSECVAGDSTVETEYHAKELGRAISAFLYTLPERDRHIFIARYFYFLSVSEIVGKMNLSVSKVKNSLFRSRKRLAAYLKQEELL